MFPPWSLWKSIVWHNFINSQPQVCTFHSSTSSMPKFNKFKGSQDPVSAINCFANIRWTEGILAVLLVIPFHQKRLHDNTSYSPKAKEVRNANRNHLLGPPNPDIMLHIDTFGNRWIVCSSHIKETLLVPKNRRQTHCKSIDLNCVSLSGSPNFRASAKNIQKSNVQWVNGSNFQGVTRGLLTFLFCELFKWRTFHHVKTAPSETTFIIQGSKRCPVL